MTDRLLRVDIASGSSMLLAGLAADGAVWSAEHRTFSLVAAGLLTLVAAVTTYQVALGGARSGHLRRVGPVVRIGACAALVAVGLHDGAFTGVAHPGHSAAIAPIALSLLLVVQLVQAAWVISRRDIAAGSPTIGLLLAVASTQVRETPVFATLFSVAVVATLAALVLVHQGELVADAVTVARPAAFRPTRPVVVQVTRVAGVAAVVFLLVPNSLSLGTQPVKHAAATANSGSGHVATDPLAYSRAIADPSSGTLDLRARGELSDTPLFEVPAGAPRYWQGAVYDHYDGSSWTVTGSAQPSWRTTRDGAGTVQSAPPDPLQPATAKLTTRSDTVRMLSTQPIHVVLAPGRVTSYRGPGAVIADAEGNPMLVDLPASTLASSLDYRVTSTSPAPSSSASSPAPSSPGDDPGDPRWTALPSDVPQRVRDLATQVIGQQPTRAATVAAAEKYLRANEKYSLAAPVPARGTDAVESFLFVTHQGFL